MVVDKVKTREEKEAEMKAQQENAQEVSSQTQSVSLPEFKEEHKELETIGERVDENGVTLKTVVCPECGNSIEMAEGCFICLNCGYSGCS